MKLPFLSATTAIGFLALGGAAGDSQLQRPVLGYATQPAPLQLRPILGVSGAAVLGNPFPLPERTTRLRLPPGQEYALFERGHLGLAIAPLSADGVGELVPIPGAIQAPDLVSFSPSGRSAILVSRAARKLQLVSGLPQAPQFVLDLDTALLPELPVTAAVSDDASGAVFSSASAVYTLMPNDSITLTAAVSQPAVLAFFAGRRAWILGDPGAGSMSICAGLGGSFEPQPIASGLARMANIAASRDGRFIYAAAAPPQLRVWAVGITSGIAQEIDVPVSADLFEPLRSADAFLLSAEAGAPAWIFTGDGAGGKTVFVPAQPTSFASKDGARRGSR